MAVSASVEGFIAHRSPFRWVDALVSVEDDGGHFRLTLSPSEPRMQVGLHPSLILVEALAQSTAAFWGAHAAGSSAETEAPKESGVIVSIDEARFLGSPLPGDDIALCVRRTHVLGPLVRFAGEAHRGDTLLCRVHLSVHRDRHLLGEHG